MFTFRRRKTNLGFTVTPRLRLDADNKVTIDSFTIVPRNDSYTSWYNQNKMSFVTQSWSSFFALFFFKSFSKNIS